MEIDYSVDDKIIDFHYKKGSKYEYHRKFQIQNEDIIVDKNSIKYHWVPFPTEDEDKQSPTDEVES